MFGLRQKLAIGFGGLLLTLLLVGGLGVAVVYGYRNALDRFLYENGRSVEYGQQVADAVDRLDALAATGWLTPTTSDGPVAAADGAVDAENHNITLDGEAAIAATLTREWADGYRPAVARLLAPGTDAVAAQTQLRELSPRVRAAARGVIDLNLANMRPLNGRAKRMADRAMTWMVVGGVAGTGLAVAFTLLVTRSILRPLLTVIGSIREIEQGNMDLVVTVKSRDELRTLAEAVNSMAAKLREYRRTNRAKLIRTQQTTQLAVDSLPDAVAVTSPDGVVELGNDAARRLFGLAVGTDVAAVGDRRLVDVYREVIASGRPSKPRGYESAVDVYDAGGQQRFYLPHAVPICDGHNGDARVVGVTLVLADVTNLRRLDEMKSGLLSVVSHELKTPLTSIRMAVHLLLEERVGPLTAKQAELVTAARDESERLDRIIADLLDMGRMESGRAELDQRPEPAAKLVDAAVERVRGAYHDKGVTIEANVSEELPPVRADRGRIGHVFGNLLTNALRFTPPGGRVRVSAEADGPDRVRFGVEDTGDGIPPEHLPRVFDRFFRVPGQPPETGAGLGLAIAREIVAAHGGDVAVASDVGRGTRFTFTLQRATDEVKL